MFQKYFISISKKKFILFSFLYPTVYTLILSLVNQFISVGTMHSDSILKNVPLYKILFYKVILGPFVETLFFQFIIIEIILWIFRKHKELISIILSGLIFGFVHYFNTQNILYTFFAIIAGLIFSTIYTMSKLRKDTNPLLLVFTIHLSINLFAFIINDLLPLYS